MADQVFNIGLGRVVELYKRVDENDPANAVLVVIPWSSTDTDAIIKDIDDVAALEALTNTTERNTNGWNRKILTDADIVAFAPDDVNDRADLDIPDQTWTAVDGAGGAASDLSINYDSDSTAGLDSDIEPFTWHDFIVTPNGGDITAQIDAAGFFRAS